MMEPGGDVAGVLGAIVRGRGLAVPSKVLEQAEAKQALKVGAGVGACT